MYDFDRPDALSSHRRHRALALALSAGNLSHEMREAGSRNPEQRKSHQCDQTELPVEPQHEARHAEHDEETCEQRHGGCDHHVHQDTDVGHNPQREIAALGIVMIRKGQAL